MVYQLSEEDKKILASESNQEQILSLLQEYEDMKNNNKKEDIKVLKLNLWSKIVSWFCGNIFFISWGKHWKGVYVHCVSKKYCHRFFLWGHDKHRKPITLKSR